MLGIDNMRLGAPRTAVTRPPQIQREAIMAENVKEDRRHPEVFDKAYCYRMFARCIRYAAPVLLTRRQWPENAGDEEPAYERNEKAVRMSQCTRWRRARVAAITMRVRWWTNGRMAGMHVPRGRQAGVQMLACCREYEPA